MKRNIRNILAMVMVATMVLGSSFCVSAHEAEPYSYCVHSYGNWQYYGTTFYPSLNVEDCDFRITHYVRVCSKCGETDWKTSEYLMDHKWEIQSNGLYRCSNCGKVMGTLRSSDEKY